MYVPAHFAAGDLDEVAAFVDRAGAADLVTFDGERLTASLLPVIWDRSGDGDGPGRLLGHLALANPQWSTARSDVPALAIVHGPQAYISPSWYREHVEHGRVVPTWNYTIVHFTGPVTFHRDAGLAQGHRYPADRPARTAPRAPLVGRGRPARPISTGSCAASSASR